MKNQRKTVFRAQKGQNFRACGAVICPKFPKVGILDQISLKSPRSGEKFYIRPKAIKKHCTAAEQVEKILNAPVLFSNKTHPLEKRNTERRSEIYRIRICVRILLNVLDTK